MPELDPIIAAAIKCGPVPIIRDISKIPNDELTLGEKIIRFAETYCYAPDGPLVGQPIKLMDFQKAFILSVYDAPEHVRTAVFSVGRRNGKSFLMGVLALAALVGPTAIKNSTIGLAAMTRDQAGVVYRLIKLMIESSPKLKPLFSVVDSKKTIKALTTGVELKALAREASSSLGQSLSVVVVDEAGQIRTAADDFVASLRTAQGSYAQPRFFVISTQAASDEAYLSKLIDTAVANQPKDTVVHVYESPAEVDLLDETGMLMANPGMGVFRDKAGLIAELEKSLMIPDQRAKDENLLLNRRTSQLNVLVAPALWRDLGSEVDHEMFGDGRPVALGLDLSRRFDLTAGVLAANDDDGHTCLWPFVFVPEEGIEERASRDGAPYAAWAKQGHVLTIEGNVMDYQRIARRIDDELGRMGVDRLTSVEFDEWGAASFKEAVTYVGASRLDPEEVEWNPVRQGFKTMGPLTNHFKELLIAGKLRHPKNPALNTAVTNAIVVTDPAGNTKVDKAKSTQRIDALVAAMMAAYAVRPEAVGDGYQSSYLEDPNEGFIWI